MMRCEAIKIKLEILNKYFFLYCLVAVKLMHLPFAAIADDVVMMGLLHVIFCSGFIVARDERNLPLISLPSRTPTQWDW